MRATRIAFQDSYLGLPKDFESLRNAHQSGFMRALHTICEKRLAHHTTFAARNAAMSAAL
jgi:hypothetical protein